MRHLQNDRDEREIPIDRVGVKDLSYPITVLDRSNEKQNTVASVCMYVDLPHNFKGTHMSRFVEILNHFRGEITMRNIPEILSVMKKRLRSESAEIEFRFPYFLEKMAPVSKIKSLMEYEGIFLGMSREGDDFVLGVKVPVMSLCPCSKEISKHGAHNQRSIVNARIRFNKFVWLEELIEIIEKSASAPLYSLLKRVDEKYITEKSYNNPVFAEDIVRNIANKFKKDNRIIWYSIEVESFESIHKHSAYAFIKSHLQRDAH